MLAKVQLLAKYGNTRVDDLTPQIIVDIAAAFGYKLDASDELLGQVVSLLRLNDIDSLADIASKPGIFEELMDRIQSFLVPEPQQEVLVRACNHCGRLNSYEVEL